MGMVITHEIMRLAELREGLVTRGHLQKHGLSNGQIKYLGEQRLLHPVFRGVDALEPPPWTLAKRTLAACLASPGVVVSDMSAAAHWRLRKTPRDVLEVVVKAPRLVRLPGVRVHRTNQLEEVDIAFYSNGLRVTTPARTLFDCAAELDPVTMASVVEDALNRRLSSPGALLDVAARLVGQGRPGAAVFGSVIKERPLERAPAESEAELVLADALVMTGMPLPTPQFPVRIDGQDMRLDLAIPPDRLDIEVDDPYWHADPLALQRDHARDLLLATDGWIVARVTTDDVHQRLRSTAAALARLYESRISRSLCA
jgi:hypothetical protein